MKIILTKKPICPSYKETTIQDKVVPVLWFDETGGPLRVTWPCRNCRHLHGPIEKVSDLLHIMVETEMEGLALARNKEKMKECKHEWTRHPGFWHEQFSDCLVCMNCSKSIGDE